MTDLAAHRAVLAELGVVARELVPLAGETDSAFAVTSVTDARFVLKVVSDPGVLRIENRVLDHLSTRDVGVAMPRVMRTADGRDIVETPTGAARLVTWVDGTQWATVPWHSPQLLHGLGETAARLVVALADLDEPGLQRSHVWDLRTAPSTIRGCLESVNAPDRRRVVTRLLAIWDQIVTPRLADLPTAVAHQDLNDFNVLVAPDGEGGYRVCGVIDVGDTLRGLRVAEVAIAAAYATLRNDDPLAAAAAVVSAFDAIVPLTDDELACLFVLAAVRLCTNAAVWAHRLRDRDWPYAASRTEHTWAAIDKVGAIDPGEAETVIRAACGREPHRVNPALLAWLRANPPSPIVTPRPEAVTHSGGVSDALLARRRTGSAEPATLPLGSRVTVDRGQDVVAPWDGIVRTLDDGTIVLEHAPGEGPPFRTIWHGVSPTTTTGRRGERFAVARDGEFQVTVSLAALPPPTAVRPSRFAAWDSTCPDPAVWLFGMEPDSSWRADDVLRVREERVARSQRSYYRRPPNLVGSFGVWLTDEDGLQYLDAVNNVTHVGHCHPRIVDAAHRQMQRLNTNSRFVYEGLARYGERLASTLPDPLDVVFFVCTGSEANDLALRMARACTGRDDVAVIDGAYHGNTTAVTAISPNRYKGPGGPGRPTTTHELPQPNRYRGPFGYDDPAAGARYAAGGIAVLNEMVATGRPPAAFIAESLMGTGGQVVLPDGYLGPLFAAVRNMGGLCISDEVQVGAGRLGDSFWGFELQGVVPDIVTMGKPLGNGHPLAAVVTTREIADAFDNGMRYFNTFAGNPVTCAVGMAVLDVIEEEHLQERARAVGAYLLDRARALQTDHLIVGDVRGRGLYAGVELVRDRDSKEPAAAAAYRISERMKDEGVIVYPNGSLDNVLKIKPPMVFEHEHVDVLIDTLDQILRAGW